jgi:hypothetical protein
MTRILWVFSAVLLCALVATPASAALMHADVMGDTVNFTNIEEDSGTGDTLPLFGQPVALDDSLDFPTSANFVATSQDGGADETDGRLTLMVTAKPLQTIETLRFLEAGLASLFTMGGDDPFAGVTGLVDIDVVEVDGAPIVPFDLPPLSLSYTPSNGDYQHSVDATGPSFSTGWTGELLVDLDSELADGGVPFGFGATKVTITLDNKLLASTAQLGASAFIDKKDFDIFVETEVIPEPTSAFMGMISLAIGGLIYRRPRA